MTEYQPYQPYPGPPPAPAGPPPILVAVAPPAPQRRVTVAFRAILVIPHVVVLYFVNIAAGVVLFIGWWAALFTGRLPEFAYTFLSGVLRWTTRVWGYSFFLTDAYPPFGLDDDPTYPVRLAIPAPQRLNRAAVFFRFILLIPVLVLGGILLYGAGTVMAFVAWVITLVAGRLPPAFALAYTAVLRYMARLYGYYWLLTAAYPGGLFGDQPGPEPAVPPATLPYGATGPGQRPVFQPATWLLALTSGARNLIIAFIVIGVLLAPGAGAVESLFVNLTPSDSDSGPASGSELSATAVDLGYSRSGLELALRESATDVTICHEDPQCVSQVYGHEADAYLSFVQQLSGMNMPSGAAADRASLTRAAVNLAQDYRIVSDDAARGADVSQARSRVDADENTFDSAYLALAGELPGK